MRNWPVLRRAMMELMKELMQSPAKLPMHSVQQILKEYVIVYDWPTVFCEFDLIFLEMLYIPF